MRGQPRPSQVVKTASRAPGTIPLTCVTQTRATQSVVWGQVLAPGQFVICPQRERDRRQEKAFGNF